ncbi:MAG: isoprenyl transferase [Clostridium sp.]|jgi:undecaprenyl diphosphate synthase|nr:isoprenyl transferase [Clostridium sp.]
MEVLFLISFFKGSKEKEIVQDNEFLLDMDRIPKHIAIIMDGNGRWAKSRNLPRTLGHKAGIESIRRIVKEGDRLGVKYMTFYAFSTENWKRPVEEVSALMKLLVQYLKQEIDELDKRNVKINVLGDISRLPQECIEEINKSTKRTSGNTGLVMNFALNYGGRDEITRAMKTIAEEVKNEKIRVEDITQDLIEKHLYTAGMPDPDVIIRPSGEQRLSNFLLWQCAYSEFWYSDVNWPDFSEQDLQRAILDYQSRDRRYGGIK